MISQHQQHQMTPRKMKQIHQRMQKVSHNLKAYEQDISYYWLLLIYHIFSSCFIPLAPSKPNYKKGPSKYSSSKKLNGKNKERHRDYPPRPEKKKQVRPQRYHPVRQPYKGNARPVRPSFEKPPPRIPQPAQRRDSGYGAPAAPQPQVMLLYILNKLYMYNN